MDIPARFAILLLRGYQQLSRLFPRHCRFYPSCSEYMRQAIAGHGLLRGTIMGSARILKCHPWHPGGLDPVPAPPLLRASALARGGR